jgi:hypothetical protein
MHADAPVQGDLFGGATPQFVEAPALLAAIEQIALAAPSLHTLNMGTSSSGAVMPQCTCK